MQQKLVSIGNNAGGTQQFKTTASNPTIGTNFKGNELKTWTPTDNSIAISNGGIIVSCVNYGVEYHQDNGTPILQNHTWTDFVNNALLNQAKFDPRVLYDNQHDRFIIVLLHGFSSTTSKILVCFSKTNNPVDGWNIYQLSGNPYQDSAWSDYPTIGISDDDLFINCNKFGDAPNYDFKKTYIYQVSLNEGYAGTSLQYGMWNNIYTPDNNDGLTLYPASQGMGQSMSEKMYFVQMMPDSGSQVYLYEINGKLSSPNKTFTAFQYPIPHFEVCANALQKDPTSGNLDSLSTGSAWTQNAFYLNRTVHFTNGVDMGNGWCGIQYGRIYLDSNKAVVTQYGDQGTDLAYSAVAAFGHDSTDQGVAIAYVQSDSNITPQCGVISVDNAMTWSSLQVVKPGDTVVNILYPPAYAVQPERWGDYTGICRKFNGLQPEVWLGAAYGANTPPRLASYGTWIAQILSNEPSTTVQLQQEDAKLSVYPNPAVDLFTLEFENQTPGIVTAGLYDATGKLMKALFNDYLRLSKNKITFNKLALPSGIYYIMISNQSGAILHQKLVIKHD
ncbi:MAG: T9SS type A sorting domain-containing protein [Chitinophagaceae bacterium]|nr:T9SS type A sorting domain-containing protein [Chitinophagaceae bacterium]